MGGKSEHHLFITYELTTWFHEFRKKCSSTLDFYENFLISKNNNKKNICELFAVCDKILQLRPWCIM